MTLTERIVKKMAELEITKAPPEEVRVDMGHSTARAMLNKSMNPKDVVMIPALTECIMGGVSQKDLGGNKLISLSQIPDVRGVFQYFTGQIAKNRGNKYPEVSSNGGYYLGNPALVLFCRLMADLFPLGGTVEISLRYSVDHETYLAPDMVDEIKRTYKKEHYFTVTLDGADLHYTVAVKEIKIVSQAEASMAYCLSCLRNPSPDLFNNLSVPQAFENLLARLAKKPIDGDGVIYDWHYGSNDAAASQLIIDGTKTSMLVAQRNFAMNAVREKVFPLLARYGNDGGARPHITEVDRFIELHATNPSAIEDKYGTTVLIQYNTIIETVFGEIYQNAKSKFGMPPLYSYCFIDGGAAPVFKRVMYAWTDRFANSPNPRKVFGGNGFLEIKERVLSVVFGMSLVD